MRIGRLPLYGSAEVNDGFEDVPLQDTSSSDSNQSSSNSSENTIYKSAMSTLCSTSSGPTKKKLK